MRELIASGAMIGPRMFVSGPGLSSQPDQPLNPERMKQPRRGARQGRRRLDQGVRLARQLRNRRRHADRDLRRDEGRRRCRSCRSARRSRFIRTAPAASAMPFAPARIRSSMARMSMTRRCRKWSKRGIVWVPTVDHNRYYIDAQGRVRLRAGIECPLKDYIERNQKSVQLAREARREDRHGIGRGLFDVRPEHARARVVREGWHDADTGTCHGHDDCRGVARHRRSARPNRAGYLADLVAVDGDPTTNIAALCSRASAGS